VGESAYSGTTRVRYSARWNYERGHIIWSPTPSTYVVMVVANGVD